MSAHCLSGTSPSQWGSCYDSGWQGEIVPEAFSHPAKVSRALIRRIYEHAFAEGWLSAGDTVVDPFGGIAGTALDAMWNGLMWVGVELEPRFVDLAQQNIDLWQRKYGSKPGFGSGHILQGDSRKLSEVIGCADLVCSSPPYVSGGHHPDQTGAWNTSETYDGRNRGLTKDQAGYGKTTGQMGQMKEGGAPRVDCVVSSPPYAGSSPEAHSTGIDLRKNYETYRAQGGGSSWEKFVASRARHQDGYGNSEGQLGAMPEGKFAAVVSSPPYAAIATGAGGLNTKPPKHPGQDSGRSPSSPSQNANEHYGESAGQLSGMAEGAFDAVVTSPPYEGSGAGDQGGQQRGGLQESADVGRR